MSYIKAQKLTKNYGSGSSMVCALDSVSFEINKGEFISVMGESGSGKSTLLAIIGSMNSPTSGEFTVNGAPISSQETHEKADFRNKNLGFVFQSFHLIPYLTILENTMLPMAIQDKSQSVKEKAAMEALSHVGLKDKGHRLPGEISGGEKERAAIARAIVNKPPILLADEPTGNLDSKTSGEIMALFKRLNKEGITIIMVTHSHECSKNADRILRLSDGKLQ